ncbi:MAG: hypothetical protein NCW75_01280 [Phycisphaera sp.]|nr:MAG: hypothetical protein NCW75_01280 [Phycisphaera sp.]
MAEPPSFTARRHSAQADGPAWADALAREPWAETAVLLKEDGGVRVLAASLRGQDVILKFYRYRGLLSRARARLGVAPGDRHWAGAALLAAEGIPAAPMLALLNRRDGTKREDCLIMGRLKGTSLLHCLDRANRGEMPIGRQHTLARAVGLQVGCILAAGLHNRDHKPSNLIVSFDETDPDAMPTVAVADCQGVHRLNRDKSRHAIRTQASLALEAIGAGVLPRKAIIAQTLRATMAAYTARRFGKMTVEDALRMPKGEEKRILASLPDGLALRAWPRIAQRIRVHGDPTPRVDPLARPRAANP